MFLSLSDLEMFYFLLRCWLSSWSGLDYLASLSWSVSNFGISNVFKRLTVATTSSNVCVTTYCRFNFCLFCQGERVAYIYPDLKTVIQGSFHQVYIIKVSNNYGCALCRANWKAADSRGWLAQNVTLAYFCLAQPMFELLQLLPMSSQTGELLVNLIFWVTPHPTQYYCPSDVFLFQV